MLNSTNQKSSYHVGGTLKRIEYKQSVKKTSGHTTTHWYRNYCSRSQAMLLIWRSSDSGGSGCKSGNS